MSTWPGCLREVAALIIDGANRVCERAPPGAAPFVLVGLALVFAWAVQRGGRLPPIVVVAAVLLAVPGWVGLLARRADAPATIAATAQKVRDLDGALERFAGAHGGCAGVGRNACLACEPILRYALSSHRACPPRGTIDLDAGALGGRCRDEGERLFCGGAP